MLKIDNTLLQEVGLGGLPAAEKNSFLKHIYETLEMRVGIRLADQMSNQQLDEFERYFEAKDDAGAFKWLETNFPNYKDIVQQEFNKLKAEVAQSAPQILAASQQQAAQGQGMTAGQNASTPGVAPVAPQPQQPVQSAPQPAQAVTPPQTDFATNSQFNPTVHPQTQPGQPATPPPIEPPVQTPSQSPFPPQQPPAGPAQ
jgi:hypothetical protein